LVEFIVLVIYRSLINGRPFSRNYLAGPVFRRADTASIGLLHRLFQIVSIIRAGDSKALRALALTFIPCTSFVLRYPPTLYLLFCAHSSTRSSVRTLEKIFYLGSCGGLRPPTELLSGYLSFTP
jgi:hypothetical protein